VSFLCTTRTEPLYGLLSEVSVHVAKIIVRHGDLIPYPLVMIYEMIFKLEASKNDEWGDIAILDFGVDDSSNAIDRYPAFIRRGEERDGRFVIFLEWVGEFP